MEFDHSDERAAGGDEEEQTVPFFLNVLRNQVRVRIVEPAPRRPVPAPYHTYIGG